MKITLNETISNMTSGDYRKRFCAEYWQTKIRAEKLKRLVHQIEAAQIMRGDFRQIGKPDLIEEPKHDCPYDMLCDQLKVMERYLEILEVRAFIEEINLCDDILEA